MVRMRVVALLVSALSVPSSPLFAQTIIEEWSSVVVPPPPPVKPVTIEPKTTALLMLDFVNQLCGKRPRCLASVPKVRELLTQARAKGVTVIYSIIPNTTTADINADVAIAPGEPWVQAGANKFFRTDLEKILKDKGAQTVIVVGTAANGAVLNTGSYAAILGMNVIVPVDGMSSETAYPEQYTAWHFANAPTVSGKSTLTKLQSIQF
jgi:nicotinamidase-related amidase